MKPRTKAAATVAAALFVACGTLAAPADGGTTDFTVTKTADTNDGTCNSDCSLREAIIRANQSGADSVFVPAGVYKLTLKGTDDFAAAGDLDLRRSMTIRGDGARSTIIDANGVDRVFHLPHQGASTPYSVAMFDIAIKGGRAPTGLGGGGIFHEAVDATLHIGSSSISGNRGRLGGGIYNQGGTLNVTRSTISGNRAPGGLGGGIAHSGDAFSLANSTVSGNTARFGGGLVAYADTDLSDSTIAFNRAKEPGGGLFVNSGLIEAKNTILSNNSSDSVRKNCSVPVSSLGNNLEKGTSCGFDELGDINAGPKLGELRNNGGPTKTHALRATSPAIDKAGFPFAATDQRGVVRPQGPGADIGAYERFFNG